MTSSEPQRLDVLLVERGLAESRARAQWLIRQGYVRCSGRPCQQPGRRFSPDVPLEITRSMPFVSRGGLKLALALDTFDLSVEGCIALDVGASTGGFTDCLLQRGARTIYAVDVGREQLHPSLRADPRVVSMEGTDIRGLTSLPGAALADIAAIDVSFISLRLVLPAVLPLLHPDGQIVALIKPQFEAGPSAVNKRGIVRQPKERQRALREVLTNAAELGLRLHGLCPVPLEVPRANREILALLRRGGEGLSLEEAIEQIP